MFLEIILSVYLMSRTLLAQFDPCLVMFAGGVAPQGTQDRAPMTVQALLDKLMVSGDSCGVIITPFILLLTMTAMF